MSSDASNSRPVTQRRCSFLDATVWKLTRPSSLGRGGGSRWVGIGAVRLAAPHGRRRPGLCVGCARHRRAVGGGRGSTTCHRWSTPLMPPTTRPMRGCNRFSSLRRSLIALTGWRRTTHRIRPGRGSWRPRPPGYARHCRCWHDVRTWLDDTHTALVGAADERRGFQDQRVLADRPAQDDCAFAARVQHLDRAVALGARRRPCPVLRARHTATTCRPTPRARLARPPPENTCSARSPAGQCWRR